MSMAKRAVSEPRKGRYAVKKQKKEQLPPGTARCQGCGLLLANNRSVSDHEMFCEGVENKHELTPIRGIEFVQGDLRGIWK